MAKRTNRHIKWVEHTKPTPYFTVEVAVPKVGDIIDVRKLPLGFDCLPVKPTEYTFGDVTSISTECPVCGKPGLVGDMDDCIEILHVVKIDRIAEPFEYHNYYSVSWDVDTKAPGHFCRLGGNDNDPEGLAAARAYSASLKKGGKG